MTSRDVEQAITGYNGPFPWRRYLVVPNISWGLDLHECDLLALSSSNMAHEIEIKISRADMRADLDKKHQHNSIKIRCLWYAGPEILKETFEELCPKNAGIILVRENESLNHAYVHRKAKPNNARKFTIEERLKMAELGTMRYWSRRT